MDGVYEHAPHDGSFMFTSESVGEGHPGEYQDSVPMQLLHVMSGSGDRDSCFSDH